MIIRILKPLVERFPLLAMTYRYLRDNWQTFEEPKDTSLGFKFVGNKIMSNGKFEIEETKLFKQIINNVEIFINVGANIGYYACIALSKNKPVIAFEPMSLNLKYLLKNIKVNNWEDKIEIHPLALTNKTNGIVEIFGGGTDASVVKGWGGTPERFVSFVACSTLDNIIRLKIINKVCLILVDIEGSELFMLEGAINTLRNFPKPIWMIEIAVSDHQPAQIMVNPNLERTFKVFWDQGYEAWTADSQCRFISPIEIKNVLASGIDSLKTHNFLFVEKGMKDKFLN